MATLTTDRLTLRPFREEDLDAYAKMCGDPEVMRYLLVGKTFSRAEAWQHMAMILGHWRLRGYGLWAVETRSDREFVGRIGFLNPEGWPGFELAWALSRPYWGKGFASEGARAALDYAFRELNSEHVISLIHPENERSTRLAGRIGECFERTIEFQGRTLFVYGIDRDAWMKASGL